MPITLYESGEERKTNKEKTSVVTGTVINNCDLIKQGKILVRIPSLDQELWARLTAPGASSGAGLFYVPRPDDEVLVVLSGDEPVDAYIIGGLWNTQDSPPVSNPLEASTKRVIKTGLAGGVGHEVEFDDGPGQSISITTSTQQKIIIDPFKIELRNTAGTLKITLDNKTQTISIAAAASLELAAVGNIKLKAANIEIGDIVKTAKTSINGKMVSIN
ncbi:conserved hypothetical protein [Nitrosococcus oceani ATCC 19707]|uniref:Gp5/Type VI secretion system Vgr protein OB-fold domain-containing protein n=2 Tax=Nitrosococcus oceani TaxID=1229 RepID=Q3JA12_NITOC|nr:phage baseplate assembly protein V [Nitrosococcus oceani]ABA58334.1 conserved hypothetical protein [Nitrosococcus oceani ATCC 19707]EDZ67012.1 hypothetical protein NOC27_339 [Nitrosococcus oceani AFC27]KFI19263.1 hypothetical protein IB75_09950 [Nitrosococcus oceani C-27]GEM18723.1 hypothetical protein NONS58_00800 [Nitrosococcus oceani]